MTTLVTTLLIKSNGERKRKREDKNIM